MRINWGSAWTAIGALSGFGLLILGIIDYLETKTINFNLLWIVSGLALIFLVLVVIVVKRRRCRNKKGIVVYDSSEQIFGTHFSEESHPAAQNAVQGIREPVGEGEIWVDNSTLHYKRKNTEGRYIVFLRRYKLGDKIEQFIPPEATTQNKRSYKVKFEIKASNGVFEIVSRVVPHRKGKNQEWKVFGQTQKMRVNRDKWEEVEFFSQVDPEYNAVFRIIDNEKVDRENAELQIRNILVEDISK